MWLFYSFHYHSSILHLSHFLTPALLSFYFVHPGNWFYLFISSFSFYSYCFPIFFIPPSLLCSFPSHPQVSGGSLAATASWSLCLGSQVALILDNDRCIASQRDSQSEGGGLKERVKETEGDRDGRLGRWRLRVLRLKRTFGKYNEKDVGRMQRVKRERGYKKSRRSISETWWKMRVKETGWLVC